MNLSIFSLFPAVHPVRYSPFTLTPFLVPAFVGSGFGDGVSVGVGVAVGFVTEVCCSVGCGEAEGSAGDGTGVFLPFLMSQPDKIRHIKSPMRAKRLNLLLSMCHPPGFQRLIYTSAFFIVS